MKRLFVSLSVLSLMFAFQNAQAEPAKKKEKAEKVKKEKPQMEEVTLSGKLVKVERTAKNKKTGEETKSVSYVIEGADGTKSRLPAPRKAKGEEVAADPYAEHVDKNVTVTGMGTKMTRKNKKGEETTTLMLRKVSNIAAQ